MRISRTLSKFFLIGCLVAVAAPFSLGQGGGGGPGGGGAGGGRGGFGGGFGGGGGMASLLTMKEVREELNIDEDQVKEIEAATKEMTEEIRTQMSGMFGGGRGPGGSGSADAGGRGAGGRGAGGPGGPGGRGAGGPGSMDFSKMQEAMSAMQAKSEEKIGTILDPIQMDRLVGLFIQRDSVRTFRSKTVASKLEITPEQKTSIAEIEGKVGEEMRSAMTPGAENAREIMDKIRKESEAKVMGVLTASQKTKMEELKGAKFEFPAPPARGGRGNN